MAPPEAGRLMAELTALGLTLREPKTIIDAYTANRHKIVTAMKNGEPFPEGEIYDARTDFDNALESLTGAVVTPEAFTRHLLMNDYLIITPVHMIRRANFNEQDIAEVVDLLTSKGQPIDRPVVTFAKEVAGKFITLEIFAGANCEDVHTLTKNGNKDETARSPRDILDTQRAAFHLTQFLVGSNAQLRQNYSLRPTDILAHYSDDVIASAATFLAQRRLIQLQTGQQPALNRYTAAIGALPGILVLLEEAALSGGNTLIQVGAIATALTKGDAEGQHKHYIHNTPLIPDLLKLGNMTCGDMGAQSIMVDPLLVSDMTAEDFDAEYPWNHGRNDGYTIPNQSGTLNYEWYNRNNKVKDMVIFVPNGGHLMRAIQNTHQKQESSNVLLMKASRKTTANESRVVFIGATHLNPR